jgi:hypothetical protein
VSGGTGGTTATGGTTVTVDAPVDRPPTGGNPDTTPGADPGRCPAAPKCDATVPTPGPARAWRHSAPSGAANHRGRDLFVNPGAPQWVIATFKYGLALFESALGDEEVDIYLLRGCGATWEKLGTALTSTAATHAPVEGVDDAIGRLLFEIPAAKALAPGRHRLRLVVAGDLSTTEVFIEVVAANTPLFVTDVDGTLTTSENAQAISLFTGAPAQANPDGAAVLSLLASKGYRPFYLTARPDWLGRTTHEWTASLGFPPGIIHTTLSSGGASGAAAGTFKTDELKVLAARGLKPGFAFGNTDTDADAYNSATVQPLTHRLFFQFTDSAFNGRRFENYGSLLAELTALPPICP